MFFVERFFCFHHHEVPGAAEERAGSSRAGHGHELTWTGAAIGLTLHSLAAGVALAASVEAGRESGASVWAAGFGAFLAVFLHKPFDSMTLGTLMAVGHRSVRFRHLVNLAFGLVVPVGVCLFFLGAGTLRAEGPQLVSCALAFSAGTFLCIALSDLLPELQFHQHDRLKLSVALLLGLAIAWGAARLEARAHEAPGLEPAASGFLLNP
jgi:zinc and cadmium transporter